MQFDFKDLEYVIGDQDLIKGAKEVAALKPFDERVINFFNDLSSVMCKYREFSDIVTYGFWCRKAAILHEKSKYSDIDNSYGRGVVFHSTPSNVPVNFAFSFTAGLLAGNINIVRLPGNYFAQVGIICNAISELLKDKYTDLTAYICFIKYASNIDITNALSNICDVRVIWGGDRTISNIRKSPLQARATDITFADRHSIVVIDANAYLESGNKEEIANAFYNDTYFTDQNACTSPRIVFWMGNNVNEAKNQFWQRIHNLVSERYTLASVHSVGKLNAMYRIAANREVRFEEASDMLVSRIHIDTLDSSLMDYKYNSGFFLEYDIKSLEEILPICNDRCQTLTYYGIKTDEINAFINKYRPRGIDRVIKMGRSMDFSLIWDGYDLIHQLSRRVYFL